MIDIELLYFDGCPSWRRAWNDLGSALAATETQARVWLRDVGDLSEEQLWGFGGSPTVRIDGRDLEGYEGPPLLACRRYAGNEGRGWPSVMRLRDALQAKAGAGA